MSVILTRMHLRTAVTSPLTSDRFPLSHTDRSKSQPITKRKEHVIVPDRPDVCLGSERSRGLSMLERRGSEAPSKYPMNPTGASIALKVDGVRVWASLRM